MSWSSETSWRSDEFCDLARVLILVESSELAWVKIGSMEVDSMGVVFLERDATRRDAAERDEMGRDAFRAVAVLDFSTRLVAELVVLTDFGR